LALHGIFIFSQIFSIISCFCHLTCDFWPFGQLGGTPFSSQTFVEVALSIQNHPPSRLLFFKRQGRVLASRFTLILVVALPFLGSGYAYVSGSVEALRVASFILWGYVLAEDT
jgi:hypothetical protein